jgi:methyl-accepting chemotaxis protein
MGSSIVCPLESSHVNRSLATKLVLAVGPVVALTIVVLTWVAVTRASDAQRTSVEQGLRDLAAQNANAIDATAARNAEIPRAMAAQLAAVPSGGRSMVKDMVHGLATHHPAVDGFYYMFDHDGYGPDAQYAGQESKSGIFQPHWYKENGKLVYAGSYDGFVGQDWWEIPKRTLHDAVIDPYVDPNLKVLMTSYVSPVVTGGKFRGLAGVDVALDNMQRSVDRLKVLDTGYSFMVTGSGAFLAAPNKKLIGSGTLAKLKRDALAPLRAAIKAGRPGQLRVADPFGKRNTIVSWAPVKTGGWAVVTVAPESEAMAPVRQLRTTLLIVGLIALLLTIAAIVLVARRLVAPLRGFVARLNSLGAQDVAALAAGMDAIAAGDLTVPVEAATQPAPVRGRDEVAQASEALNDVIERTQASAHAYESTRAALSATLGEVASGAAEVATASQRMADTSSQAGAAVQEIARAMGDVAGGAERQSQMAGSTQARAESVTGAMHESAQNAQETAQAAEQARAVAQDGATRAVEAGEAMRAMRESSASVSDAIGELAQRSERIGGIVETITGIAEQTNLLALNAAIEAARAGDQGRGFAVVADEVRKLAEESQGAAASIGDLVAEIRVQTEQTVHTVAEDAARTEATAEVVESTQAAFTAIAQAIADVTARADEIVRTATRVAHETEEVQREVSEIAAVAEQSSAASEQVSASTQQTTASTQEIAGAAGELAEAAARLDGLVRQFQRA